MRRVARTLAAAAAAASTTAEAAPTKTFAEQLRLFDVSVDGSRLRSISALVALLNAAGTASEVRHRAFVQSVGTLI